MTSRSTDPADFAFAVVTPDGRRRIEAGHPWVYRQDVTSGPLKDARSDGPTLVSVRDTRGTSLGVAMWAVGSPVALRMLARASGDGLHLTGKGPVLVNSSRAFLDYVKARIDRALALRQQLQLDRSACRLVHAEGDDLPGLFVDRYEQTLVVQAASVAMEVHLPAIVDHLVAVCTPDCVILRNDGSMRDFEGLPRIARVAWPRDETGNALETRTRVRYRLAQVLFEANLFSDGKTGGFLDQADNHAYLARLAPASGQVVDAFAFHGGFALALAKRSSYVLAADIDRTAVERIVHNANINGFGNVEARQADAFLMLAELETQGKTFDVVVIDPPALAKRSSDLKAARRGYGELLLRGFRLTKPGGLLAACSCSGQIDRADWDGIVAHAAGRAGRTVQVLARRSAGADHPERLGVSETGHLKCWVLRVL